MSEKAAKTSCRTPAEGRDGTVNIPTWKFNLLRVVILEAVANAGSEGFPFKEIREAVRSHLSPEQLEQLGSVSWHTTTVKLEMEVAGEIRRVPGVSPQRLVIAGSQK